MFQDWIKPPPDKSAPGIRSWDSDRCKICNELFSNHSVTILSRKSRYDDSCCRKFHTTCYTNIIDNNDYTWNRLRNEAICPHCDKQMTADSSYVFAKEGKYNQEYLLYIMHEECFEEIAGKDFWDIIFFQ